jgi:transmembrane 9 superfamily member 2/4
VRDRVVGFAVEPLSIRHEFNDEKILTTCPRQVETHVTRSALSWPQGVNVNETIVYTYDVIWNPSDVKWSSRWDAYLWEDHLIPVNIHLYSIVNSILIVVLLSAMLLDWIRRHAGVYNSQPILEDNGLELSGHYLNMDESRLQPAVEWLRPVSSYPVTYCVFCGSGAQLGVTFFLVLFLSAFGLVNPANPGSLLNTCLLSFMVCGVIAGYVSALLFQGFESLSAKRQLCTTMTALLVPGLSLGLLLCRQRVLNEDDSMGGEPCPCALFVWLGATTTLVFCGAYFGYQAQSIGFIPVSRETAANTATKSAEPSKRRWMTPLLTCGIVLYSIMSVEIFFLMASLWMGRYFFFGFSLVIYVILLVACAETSILLACDELRFGGWHAFACTGSLTAVFTFVYSMFWFHKMEPAAMGTTYLLYFGYMALICFYLFLILGSVGALSSLWFVRRLLAREQMNDPEGGTNVAPFNYALLF